MHCTGAVLRIAAILIAASALTVCAQPGLAGAAEAILAVEKLRVTGSALMIAAHPDDENTALLAWLARGRKLRTGYLSLTRGEGGQNLIGAEQGDLLGIIRTEELLAARRLDGPSQFFTRAIDFGFSKSADETLGKWGREEVLGDVVWVIRKFRPDVIVLRFSGTPRDGHGHHQASALLGKEAFDAAADPKRFPEQLKWVEPWRARRVVWNAFAFTAEQERSVRQMPGRIEVDTGDYNPLLGFSYAEIAGMSRSMHRSQGMGAPQRKGPAKDSLIHVAGEAASRDLFDGIETSWKRFPGADAVSSALDEASRALRPEDPTPAVPHLLKARAALTALPESQAAVKTRLSEIDEALALSSGLWVDAVSQKASITPGSNVSIQVTALVRSRVPIRFESVNIETDGGFPVSAPPPADLAFNVPLTHTLSAKISERRPYSEPYWLRVPREGGLYGRSPAELRGEAEGEPEFRARFTFTIGGQRITLVRPVIHRYVDRVLGETTRPVHIVPPVAIQVADYARMFPSERPQTLSVLLRALAPAQSGELALQLPAEWQAAPEKASFELEREGEQVAIHFLVRPPAGPSRGSARLQAVSRSASVSDRAVFIDYPHIPPQTYFPPSAVALARTDTVVLAKTVGYVMGAGDDVPEALRQLGCDVTLLDSASLADAPLSRFDAIITGVRAYNVRADLRANQARLIDYVAGGGTMVVQYNVLEGFAGDSSPSLGMIGPYPLKTGRQRVAVEESPVEFVDPKHPLLNKPNRITPHDFEGWIQERGLYFAAEWDPRYQAPLSTADPGEKPLRGGLLYARHGKGVYVFTAFSFFRQLPAGVEGGYRLFANLISAGKAGD